MSLLRISLAALSVAALVAGSVWFAYGSEHMRFRSIRVVGNERASGVQLRHLTDLTFGEPLLSLDLAKAAAGVARHPWVAQVEARRVFPDTVVIQVRERQVRALLLLDQLYLVDTEGNPFRKADTGELNHPVITGLPPAIAESDPALARRIVHEALRLLDASSGRGGLHEDEISEVRFDAEAGYTLALRNGSEVLLGFQEEAALARLDTLTSRGVDLSRPVRVDLGSPSLAVVAPL